jgi:16S rRNA processing protein RimM
LTDDSRPVSVGRVGKAHGYDGSFYVEGAEHPLEEGSRVSVGGRERRVDRRGGTDERPLVRLSGVDDRETAIGLQGESLLVELGVAPLKEGEWLTEDLVGLRVEGRGSVRRVFDGPSCAVLELEDGTLVPFIDDAVLAVDPDRGLLELDLGFLGLEEPG